MLLFNVGFRWWATHLGFLVSWNQRFRIPIGVPVCPRSDRLRSFPVSKPKSGKEKHKANPPSCICRRI
ncbi:hypothetical protein L1887_39575 [Cichorium endivia]|nr:hypothetical protein L1887_39575 [Cichorium endivia]